MSRSKLRFKKDELFNFNISENNSHKSYNKIKNRIQLYKI